ncbi:amidase [Rathayibacter sp. VKM Ac-2805]|nr:amidase [Rathayibacter sp. VKM Ac-2805]
MRLSSCPPTRGTALHPNTLRRRGRLLAATGALAAGALVLAGCTPDAADDSASARADLFVLEEATIAQAQHALESGALTSVELTAMYLDRIHAYDVNGLSLDSIPVLDPGVMAAAEASDARRAAGETLGPLDGIPYTVKDSYMVEGLTVASGSPAFADLTAASDAFTVEKIREAGGVLIGKTNMPPMAGGGMQRGVYGRAESPYNADFLPAAWFSGSSNGSGTSTAANFAMFGMGEETVSSGRSPASNSGLIAYTPSRGMISIRGNWPLFPVRDVVVPHTRTVDDMLTLLNTIVVEDENTENDFWRDQTAVDLPSVEDVRPDDFTSLADAGALEGVRLGVPKMYIGEDLGGSNPIRIRPSIKASWDEAADDLRALGAEVVEVDLPVQHNQDLDRVGAVSPESRGLMPADFGEIEFSRINPYAAEKFLKAVGDPELTSWTQVDTSKVFPNPPGSLAEQDGVSYGGYMDAYPAAVADGVPAEWSEVDGLQESLQGLEDTRKVDFEEWLDAEGLDGIVFPANSDIGEADADVDREANTVADRNGNYFSNMNYTLRMLGIPTVSVPMGLMDDTHMPVNLTIAGPAYDDAALLGYAYAYEAGTHNREAPTRTPALAGETVDLAASPFPEPERRSESDAPEAALEAALVDGALRLSGTATDASELDSVRVSVNGERIAVDGGPAEWSATLDTAKYRLPGAFAAAELYVSVVVKDAQGNTAVVSESVPLG